MLVQRIVQICPLWTLASTDLAFAEHTKVLRVSELLIHALPENVNAATVLLVLKMLILVTTAHVNAAKKILVMA